MVGGGTGDVVTVIEGVNSDVDVEAGVVSVVDGGIDAVAVGGEVTNGEVPGSTFGSGVNVDISVVVTLDSLDAEG